MPSYVLLLAFFAVWAYLGSRQVHNFLTHDPRPALFSLEMKHYLEETSTEKVAINMTGHHGHARYIPQGMEISNRNCTTKLTLSLKFARGCVNPAFSVAPQHSFKIDTLLTQKCKLASTTLSLHHRALSTPASERATQQQ